MSGETARLRTVLEKQPSCLMRLAIDGTLLAASDAALSLLGAGEVAQVLDTNFVERIHSAGALDIWKDFVVRVTSGGSASVECEMNDLTGARRAVLLLGVALPDHPDGITSLLVTVRDISTARGLEASLHAQEGLRQAVQTTLRDTSVSLEQLRKQVEELATERNELRVIVASILSHRAQIASAIEQLRDALAPTMEAAARARQMLEKERST